MLLATASGGAGAAAQGTLPMATVLVPATATVALRHPARRAHTASRGIASRRHEAPALSLLLRFAQPPLCGPACAQVAPRTHCETRRHPECPRRPHPSACITRSGRYCGRFSGGSTISNEVDVFALAAELDPDMAARSPSALIGGVPPPAASPAAAASAAACRASVGWAL